MKILVLILSGLMTMSYAETDFVNDAIKICLAKNQPLKQCPEYNEAISKAQHIGNTAVNDPKIKAQNKAAIDQAVAISGANK